MKNLCPLCSPVPACGAGEWAAEGSCSQSTVLIPCSLCDPQVPLCMSLMQVPLSAALRVPAASHGHERVFLSSGSGSVVRTKQILITIEGADTPCVSTSETRPINLKLFPTPSANSSINNYAPERKEIAFPLAAMSAHHLETPPHLPFHAGGGALISVTCKHLLPWFSASLRLCLDTAMPCPTY